MTSVADSIGIRSREMADATLASVVTVRLASGDEGSTLARPSTEGIALWYQSDEMSGGNCLWGACPVQSAKTMKLQWATPERSPRRCITSRSRASPRS